MEIIEGRDPELWKLAQKRAAFRKHLNSYLIVNGFLWLIWFVQDGNYFSGVPWPVWPTLGWGIGLAFNYFDAYQGDKSSIADQEYEKLKREKENRSS